MSLRIDHYPNQLFAINFPFGLNYTFKVDLNQSFKDKLGSEQLTKALALKIFKQIKLKSDILSFLTKPIVFIPLSVAAFAAGSTLPNAGIALIATRLIVCLLGYGMLRMSLEVNFFSLLSQTYSNQSKRAAEYIKNLESSNHELAF